MSYNVEIHSPRATAPCGLELDLPFSVYSAMKAAGGETLVIDACPKCREEHRIPLNALTEITVSVKPKPGLDILRSPLAGNGRQG